MTDTRHLDRALELLRKKEGAGRKQSKAFALTHFPDYSVLQSPRGKQIETFYGTKEQREQTARKRIPEGYTLTIF
jgi:hypothetical protein